MLRNAVTGVTVRSITRCQPKHIPKIHFHCTNRLREKYNPRRPLDCPVSNTEDCKTFLSKPCRPTDPPVRPCSEQDCPEKRNESCCASKRISNNICEKPVKASEFKRKPDKFISMWEKKVSKERAGNLVWDYPPECCPMCPDIPFDVMYYRPSNKCRQFQRTWWECCPRMVPKRVCCWCDSIPPEISRRCLPLCPRTSCMQGRDKKRMDCVNQKAKGCPRQTMPCCRASRIPPNCQLTREPTDCVKTKCPFPSYSECDRMDPAVVAERPRECGCSSLISICEAYRFQNRKERISQKYCFCPTCE
ncbi:uncharacterized protein LOC115764396 isoform X1 [Drosophila novamexicana]|uniref:uncharacterized protein LOC115764396 isoform X1 n=1 Tax=Drosophila novamexicana TaxID=47314 RepID=UPI0011E5E13B|nr:uncharacterized protein LOC115764396 isoform X1 [Drosophila novamexicana]